MTSTNEALTVVVPTRNRLQHLVGCLEALHVALRPDDELLVVDSSDEVIDPATASRFGATVVPAPGRGVSWARNAGVAAATNDCIAFIDDDIHVAPTWRDAVIRPLADSKLSFVTGRIEVMAGQDGLQRPLTLKTEDVGAVIDPEYPAPVGHSANMAVRREPYVAVGGFDENMGPGARWVAGEDLDLFDRLLAAKHIGWYEPGALAYHDQWRTRRQLINVDWNYGMGLGARLAKLLRTDRARARRAFRECYWSDGFLVLFRAVRRWEEFMIATTASRLAGTTVSLVGALVRPRQRAR